MDYKLRRLELASSLVFLFFYSDFVSLRPITIPIAPLSAYVDEEHDEDHQSFRGEIDYFEFSLI